MHPEKEVSKEIIAYKEPMFLWIPKKTWRNVGIGIAGLIVIPTVLVQVSDGIKHRNAQRATQAALSEGAQERIVKVVDCSKEDADTRVYADGQIQCSR